MDKIFKLNKGDIIYVDLGHHSDSSVQSGKRPCVVVSCDTDNNINGNPIVNVCPCTTKYEKKKRRTHVLLREDDVEGYLMKMNLILVNTFYTMIMRHSKLGLFNLMQTALWIMSK